MTFVWGLERPQDADPGDDLDGLQPDPRNPFGAAALEETARRVGSRFENPTTSEQERAAVPAWDNSFDAVSEDSQAWMLSFCRDLRNSEATSSRLKDPNSVVCFAEDVDVATRAASGGGLASPMSPGRYGAALRRYGRSEANDGAVRWFTADDSRDSSRGGPILADIPANIGGTKDGDVASVTVTTVLRMSSVSSSTAELVAEHELARHKPPGAVDLCAAVCGANWLCRKEVSVKKSCAGARVRLWGWGDSGVPCVCSRRNEFGEREGILRWRTQALERSPLSSLGRYAVIPAWEAGGRN